MLCIDPQVPGWDINTGSSVLCLVDGTLFIRASLYVSKRISLSVSKSLFYHFIMIMSTMAQPNNIRFEKDANSHTKRPSKSLMDLPTELHIHISSFLSYPDALALKHTSRHFYSLVYTGVELKIDWLVERFERKLECPMEKCSFRTDASFCNWRIKRIMERRRRHLECRAGRGGCFVIYGKSCTKGVMPIWLRKELKGWKRWRNEGELFRYIFSVRLELLTFHFSFDIGRPVSLLEFALYHFYEVR